MTPYAIRRLSLVHQLDDDSIAIIVGNRQQVRNLNIKYPFKQDNDFYYLTGFNEPDCVAVIRPGHDNPYIMFARELDQNIEVQFGFRTGLNRLESELGVDKAYDINQFDSLITSLFEQRHKLFICDNHGNYRSSLYHWLTAPQLDHAFDSIKVTRSIHQLAPIIHRMRLVKDQHEIELIRHAVTASVNGHIAAMRACHPGINEGQLSATFNHEISKHGCYEVGYPNIVAAGNNGICLHYEDNNQPCIDGQLLLTDMGGEFQHYTADITRTYPINGVFTSEQAILYQLVLDALDASIALVQPGASWNTLYEINQRVMTQGLIELGILNGELDTILAQQLQRKFTVHKTGHWLGLHVHDVGNYHDANDQWIKLVPNMVLTIEPGIYIPQDCNEVEERWRGIAIRIEDDILVTENGRENLSENAPRTIADIQATMV